MTAGVRCEECSEPLRSKELRHRLRHSLGAEVFYHTRQSGHDACSDAAMKLYRQRRGAITYVRPTEQKKR